MQATPAFLRSLHLHVTMPEWPLLRASRVLSFPRHVNAELMDEDDNLGPWLAKQWRRKGAKFRSVACGEIVRSVYYRIEHMALRKKSRTYAFSMSQLLYAQALVCQTNYDQEIPSRVGSVEELLGRHLGFISRNITPALIIFVIVRETITMCSISVVFVFAIIRSYRSSSALTPPWPLIFLSFALLLSTAHRPTLFLILLASLTTSTTEVKNSEQLLFNNLNNFHRCRSRYSLQRDWSPHSICTWWMKPKTYTLPCSIVSAAYAGALEVVTVSTVSLCWFPYHQP